MIKNFLGGWNINPDVATKGDAASAAAAAAAAAMNAGRSTIAPNPSMYSEARSGVSSSPLAAAGERNDDEDADDSNDTLVQFPVYGTRSQAQNSNLNPTADWLLGGTANIPSQQQLLLKQQKQQQQVEEEKEDEKPNGNGNSKTNVSPSIQPINRDWDDDEQILWRRKARSTKGSSSGSLDDPTTTTTRSSLHKETSDATTTTTTTTTTTNATTSTLMAPQLQDPVKDWIYAYYYHTGVTPKIEMTRPHPLFDRGGPTSNNNNNSNSNNVLSKSLPRSAFSGHEPSAYSSSAFKSDGGGTQHHYFSMSIREHPDEEDTKEIDTDDGDEDDFEGIIPSHRQRTALDPSPDSQITAGKNKSRDDRQHWMPDRLCKHCYACDTPFTVFRRRHHCRICGQVFCNNCSGFFVPAQQQDSGSIHSTATLASNYNNPNSAMNNNSNNNTNKTILRACKMCYEQVTERRQLMEEEEDHAGRKRRKNIAQDANSAATASNTGSIAGTSVISSPSTQQQALAHPASAAASPGGTGGGPTSPTLQEQLDRGADSSLLHSLSKKRTESAYARRSLISQQEALEREEKEQASKLLQSQTELERKAIQLEREASSRDLVIAQATSSGSPDRAFHKRLVRITSSGSLSEERPLDQSKSVEEGNRHLDMLASNHLEQMGKVLLSSDAPLLFPELSQQSDQPNKLYDDWISTLMALATRCCSTVEPNVKKGDLLDIRPYVKIKVIPGGSYQDCAYISGILFRKTVSHKRMAKEIVNPSIMLLSGGIEFTRTENRIASLETLMEQEGKYIEILVGKILKVKPDILMVGRAVSRKAQELLLQANVTLVQHVKASLLNRISRQTGATIISSTDHIMNQFGAHVLGRCNRFRIIVARDNEIWIDQEKSSSPNNKHPPMGAETNQSSSSKSKYRDISQLLRDTKLTNPERQAALAANMLGEYMQDGYEAVRSGLAKRGVAQTYVMLEGCPKNLGCTVVLRGASRAALKQVKIVFRFLVNAAYNLRLETSFLKERCAQLQPSYEVKPENLFSSSLCVDYGVPPSNRKIRPWNGGSNNNDGQQRSISGQVTAFDHQSILISSVWMTDKTQCCPAEVKGICYYSMQDVSLGQFLRDSCFNLSLKCQNPSCKKSVLDHSLSFVHNDGLINITVDHMDDPLPPAPTTTVGSTGRKTNSNEDNEDGEDTEDPAIATWTYCKNCAKVVTPLVYISENTWKYSFGKFLESFFYNRQLMMNSPQNECKCHLQTSSTLYFGCGRLAARFTYERVRPFGVFVRKSLPIDLSFHRKGALRELEQISMASSLLFVKFDKHIEKVSREARSLYASNANRPDHLQTVLSELNRISSEVDHAAKTLQEKIASVSHKCANDDDNVVSDALLRFPWFARRYLFMLTSAWNEKLSAAGQAIVAMKKLASSSTQRNDSLVGPNVPAIVGDQNHDELHEGIRRLRQLHEVYSRYNITDISTVLPILPGGDSPKAEIEYDDDFEDPDGTMDFSDSVDADVLASRRRLYQEKSNALEVAKGPTKSLGTRRSDAGAREIPNSTLATKVTPGGAVKSALTRFFNRGGREFDPYIVNLGIFSQGRPRLEPGVNGIVVPVIDEQLCTVIAYSLSSTEYVTQFQGYTKMEASNPESTSSGTGLAPPGGAESGVGSSTHPTDKIGIERRMLVRNKSHIKHTFRDFDEKGQNLCKFVCTTYWATQFEAVRQAFLSPHGAKSAESNSSGPPTGLDIEQAYVQSLSSADNWAASGGKSGASFARTSDDRFVIKCISRTELQMFLESAPAYFEYLSKAFFHGLPTVLCKIVGVYQIGYHNRVTGKRSMEQVAVMQNIFYNKKITRTFDLKGSLRGRFAAQIQRAKDDHSLDTPSRGTEASSAQRKHGLGHGLDGEGESDLSDNGETSNTKDAGTLLDGDFLEFTSGRPMPMNDRAKAVFHMSILNDTLFLSIINVLDYSILVGVDEERMELVVGIIDFMRQYDILKQMERVGKSLPMVVGSEAPTIIQPPLYKARFTNAMERYFMTVPSKWTTI